MSNLPSKFDSNSGLSRRDLLLGASAGAAVSFAAPALAMEPGGIISRQSRQRPCGKRLDRRVDASGLDPG